MIALRGSVATAMVHHAPCSVLVARRAEEQPFPATILHAGDGSDDSNDAARLAADIAGRHGSRLLTLRVEDEGDEVDPEDALAVLLEGGGDVETRVASGPAHERIPEMAEAVGATLVVVGSRGTTGLKSLGSVSERVAHQAPCSVLIVRRPSHLFDDDPAA